jgi:hypothetical protein
MNFRIAFEIGIRVLRIVSSIASISMLLVLLYWVLSHPQKIDAIWLWMWK